MRLPTGFPDDFGRRLAGTPFDRFRFGFSVYGAVARRLGLRSSRCTVAELH